MARGTTARMGRDTEVTWQGRGGPREALAAHRAQTHGKRPRASTQVHADARVECHVAMGGRHIEGPGVSGPW